MIGWGGGLGVLEWVGWGVREGIMIGVGGGGVLEGMGGGVREGIMRGVGGGGEGC